MGRPESDEESHVGPQLPGKARERLDKIRGGWGMAIDGWTVPKMARASHM